MDFAPSGAAAGVACGVGMATGCGVGSLTGGSRVEAG